MINGLSQAWTVISEPQKIEFLQILAKESDMNLVNLLKRRANLSKAGCSQNHILGRSTDLIRTRMDGYFASEDGQIILFNLAYRFFHQIGQCIDERYWFQGEVVRMYKNGIEYTTDCLEDICSRLKERFPENSYMELFTILSKEIFEKMPVAARKSWGYTKVNKPPVKLSSRERYALCVSSVQILDDFMQKIRAFSELDSITAQQTLAEACIQIILFREQLAVEAETHGVKFEEWDSPEGALRFIETLEKAAAKANGIETVTLVDSEISPDNGQALISTTPLESKITYSSEAPESEYTESVQFLAKKVLDAAKKDKPAAVSHLVWKLLNDEEIPVACHVMKAAETALPRQTFPAPSALSLECLILSAYAHANRHGIITRLYEICGENMENTEGALNGVAFASRLRIALWSPYIGGKRLLFGIRHENETDDLLYVVETVVSEGIVMLPGILNRDRREGLLAEQKTRMLELIRDWIEKARKFDIFSDHALRVWREWLKPGNLLDGLFDPFIQNNRERISKIPETIAQINIDGEIDKTLRSFGGTAAIDGVPRNILLRRAKEALGIAGAAASLFIRSSAGNEANTLMFRTAKKFDNKAEIALNKIKASRKGTPSERVAARLTSEAIKECRVLLAEKPQIPHGMEITPELLLNTDLIRLKNIVIGASLDELVLSLARYGIASWTAVFDELCRSGDRYWTRRILDTARLKNWPSLKSLEDKLCKSLKNFR